MVQVDVVKIMSTPGAESRFPFLESTVMVKYYKFVLFFSCNSISLVNLLRYTFKRKHVEVKFPVIFLITRKDNHL